MKHLTILAFAAFAAACSNSAAPIRQDTNAASAPPANTRTESVIAHSNEGPPAGTDAPTAKGKWTQSGTPIDTKAFDSAIAAADKELKAKPADEALKKKASKAYFDRAMALTQARQYASALGDYRRAYKIDAANEEAKTWIDEIIKIYGTINKEYPKEGEEPPPLPFNGEQKQ
ncbi:MAG: hypothetical protein HS105_03230 [Chloracidobacterium sp.]|nr:hypothetical protein [Chloracidobacterium sp.]MCC6825443.1 hypothetical protein [Acidobacteriota bacterium]MCO5334859.1 hypothetical protein [Pyrinomonadaceae bacterium]